MKIQQINSFFRRLGAFQIHYRWWFLLLTVLLLAVGISGMSRVRTANSRENWFYDSEEIEIATERFEEQFGNNENVGILITAKDVFSPEVLAAIDQLGEEFLLNVPYADEVISLTELEISVGTAEGIEVINPFEEGIPEDPERLDEIRELIMSRQSLVNRLVSDDGTETWLTLELLEYPEEEEWSKSGSLDPMFEVGEAAIAIVTDPRWESDLYSLKAAGMPYTETEERDFFGRETMIRVLSGFLLMIVLLVLFLHSLRGVLVPVFTTGAGIIVVFGIMGWLGIELDANMVTLPVLLGMALAVGYSIHMVNAFKRNLGPDTERREAAIIAVEETGWPIFFTAITTMGSVMSFAATGIQTISWLGFTSAAVVLVNYLFVIILVPILMSFGKNRGRRSTGVRKASLLDLMMGSLASLVLKRRVPLLLVVLICVGGLAPGVAMMKVNMDMFRFMGTKVPYIQRVWEVVNSQLGSYLAYNITIEYEETDAIKDPETLRHFEALLDTVGGFELTKSHHEATSVFSILDIIKEMNQTLNDDDPAFYTIPENRDLVAQLLFLYEISGGTKTFRWIDEDYSMMRARVQVWKFDANEIVRELDTIKRIGQTSFPGAKVSVVGSAVQFAELNKKIVTGEIMSILVALLVIGILLIAVFGSFKTGLIGMLPNIMPLVAIAGYMGYTRSPLDMMTMTIMPMLLGVAVDDTIHFINHVKYEFERCLNYEKAIRASFVTVGKNLAMTTIILGGTFAMYTLSPVSALGRIGMLASIGLLVALITDYLATPAFILLTKPFGEEK